MRRDSAAAVGNNASRSSTQVVIGLLMILFGAQYFWADGGWSSWDIIRTVSWWYGVYLFLLWRIYPSMLFPSTALPSISDVRQMVGLTGDQPAAGAQAVWVADGAQKCSEAWFFAAPPAEGSTVEAQGLRETSLNGACGVVKQRQPGGMRVVVDFGGTVGEKALLPMNLKTSGPVERLPCVVFLHGNGEFIDVRADTARWYQSVARCHVLLPEYRGYGRSEGTPNPTDITADVTKHIDWLVQRPDVDPSRLLYHGVSVGGAVAAGVCSKHPPAGMVLQSTFHSVARMGARYCVPEAVANLIIGGCFDTSRELRRLREATGQRVRFCLAHGCRDEIVPHSHGEALAAELGTALYSPVCGHNDFPNPSLNPVWAAKLSGFVSSVVGGDQH